MAIVPFLWPSLRKNRVLPDVSTESSRGDKSTLCDSEAETSQDADDDVLDDENRVDLMKVLEGSLSESKRRRETENRTKAEDG